MLTVIRQTIFASKIRIQKAEKPIVRLRSRSESTVISTHGCYTKVGKVNATLSHGLANGICVDARYGGQKPKSIGYLGHVHAGGYRRLRSDVALFEGKCCDILHKLMLRTRTLHKTMSIT